MSRPLDRRSILGFTRALAGLTLCAGLAPAQQYELTLEDVLDPPQQLQPVRVQAFFMPDGSVFSTRFVKEDEVLGVEPRGDGEWSQLATIEEFKDECASVGLDLGDAKRFPQLGSTAMGMLRFVADDTIWHWGPGQAPAPILRLPAGGQRMTPAPNDLAAATVVNGNLQVVLANGTARTLSDDGRDGFIEYGEAAHRSEFGIREGIFWSENSARVAFTREDFRPIELFPRADYDSLPAQPVEGRYPMAGRTHSIVRVGVYDLDNDRTVWLESSPQEDRYWTNITFTPDGNEVWVALVDRSQKHAELTAFDAATGKKLRVLVEEDDEEWVEPEWSPIFVPGTNHFLWASSRNGYRHLYRLDRETGELLWQETDGLYDLRKFHRIVRMDDQDYLFVSGCGERDPRDNHLLRVRMGQPQPMMAMTVDDSEWSPKTEQWTLPPGWHEARVAADGTVIDQWSSLYQPEILERISPQRKRHYISPLANALRWYDIGRNIPFEFDTEDGAHLYGIATLPPRSPEPLRKYPVLLYVYGGPHVQLVKNRWRGGLSLWQEYLASQGYVIVRIDGRGTPGRGRDFEQEVHRHLGEIEVLDQLAGLQFLKSIMPYIDLANVGVHGWSFGGYMTLRLMTLAPEMFTCGVAGAPVTDWRQYETGYTERYMDTPQENPDGYEGSAVATYLDGLADPLLLVHGTDDATVLFSHSMSLLDRAIQTDTEIEFMAYPGEAHGLRGKARRHFVAKMIRFFREHLPAIPPSSEGR
ncbi:MAG: prolyl oligopeptidase family serine peptidase [Planctomycetota bacterium]